MLHRHHTVKLTQGWEGRILMKIGMMIGTMMTQAPQQKLQWVFNYCVASCQQHLILMCINELTIADLWHLECSCEISISFTNFLIFNTTTINKVGYAIVSWYTCRWVRVIELHIHRGILNFSFWTHLCPCMVGSYALHCVCPPVWLEKKSYLRNV